MTAVLIHARPLNPVNGVREDVRAAYTVDPEFLGVDGIAWEPAVTVAPTISQQVNDPDLQGRILSGSCTFTLSMEPFDEFMPENLRSFDWQGATVVIRAGDVPVSSLMLEEFIGEIVEATPNVDTNELQIRAIVPTLFLDKPVLTAQYQGTGGIEGTQQMKGTLKPWGFGFVENAPASTPVNAVDYIYQMYGYGAVAAIPMIYEDGAPYGPSVGDWPDYESLRTAPIGPGRWGTCLALGLFRVGAPPVGVLTADVQFNGSVWPAMVIYNVARAIGVQDTQIDQDSIAMMNQRVSREIRWFTREQVQAGDLIQRIAQSCNWTAFVSAVGKLTLARALPATTSSETFVTDGSGDPQVTRVEPRRQAIPYWRVDMFADYNFYVHRDNEIRWGGQFTERGSWTAGETYREGDIVLHLGASYMFLPAANMTNTPEPGTPAAAGYWALLSGSSAAEQILRVVASATAFTFNAAGLPAPGSQSITLTAIPPNGEAVTWSADPNITMSGTGNSRTINIANFGFNTPSVTITAQTASQSTSITIYRVIGFRYREGLLSERPAGEIVGELYYARDKDITYRWSGSAWVDTSSLGAPAGTDIYTMPASYIANFNTHEFTESFDFYSEVVQVNDNWHVNNVVDLVESDIAGGKALRVSGTYTQVEGKRFIPYDAEDLYCIEWTFTVRVQSNGLLYLGVVARDQSFNNIQGNGTYQYVAAQGGAMPAPGRYTVKGYFRGISTAQGVSTDPSNPAPLRFGNPNPSSRPVRVTPLALFDYAASVPGTVDVDEIRIYRVTDFVPRHRGNYANDVLYYMNDTVSYGTNAFMAKHDGIINQPPPGSATSDANWLLIGGSGAPGATGPATYTWLAYADSPDGWTNFTTGAPGVRAYLGTRSGNLSPTPSGYPPDYNWQLVKGPQGDQGVPGTPGATGAPGNPAVGFVQDSYPGPGQFVSQLWYRPGYREFYRWDGGGWAGPMLGQIATLDLIGAQHISANSITVSNLYVIQDLTIGTNKIQNNAIAAPYNLAGGDTFISASGGENQWVLLQPDFVNIDPLTQSTGSAIIVASMSIDTGTNFDGGWIVRLYIDFGMGVGWEHCAYAMAGIRTNDGSTVFKLPVSINYTATGRNFIRCWLTATPFAMPNSSLKSAYFTNVNLSIQGAKK